MFKSLFGRLRRPKEIDAETLRNYVRGSRIFLKKVEELDPVRRAGFHAIVDLHLASMSRLFGDFEGYLSAPQAHKVHLFNEWRRAFADARRPDDDMFGINQMAEHLVLMHIGGAILGMDEAKADIERIAFRL